MDKMKNKIKNDLKKSIFVKNHKIIVNPLKSLFFAEMCFKSWKKYKRKNLFIFEGNDVFIQDSYKASILGFLFHFK